MSAGTLMHHGREWHLCLARHSALLYRRHEHKSIRDLMERRCAAAPYLADHWQHIGGVLIGDCLERRYSGLAGVIELWATKCHAASLSSRKGHFGPRCDHEGHLVRLGNLFRDACNAAGVFGSAHGVRKITRAAENGATVPELEAIFGWHGGGMASHYTKEASRVRLAREAIHKLANETRTSNPSPCDEVRALGPKG